MRPGDYTIKVWDDAGRPIFKDQAKNPEMLGDKFKEWVKKFR